MASSKSRCFLGKRKARCSKSQDEFFLLDPAQEKSHAPSKSRSKQVLKSIAEMLGFGRRRKKGEELERIGYEQLERKEEEMERSELGFEWRRFGEEMGEELGKKKKRPRLEELLGWSVKLGEKDEIEV